VHTGGEISFEATGSRKASTPVSWKSENQYVLSIDAKTGKARALNPGVTHVQLNDISNLRTKVRVFEADKLLLSPNSDRTLTNNPQSFRYKEKYELEFEAEFDGRKLEQFEAAKHSLASNNLRFKCESIFAGLFNLEHEILKLPDGKQKLVCVVHQLAKHKEVQDFPERVSVLATLYNTEGFKLSTTADLAFDWGFVVGNLAQVPSSDQAEVNPRNKRFKISVKSPRPLEVSMRGPFAKHLLHKYVRLAHQNPDSKFHVILIQYPEDGSLTQRTETTLTIRDISTEQTHELPVLFDPHSSSPRFTADPKSVGSFDILVVLICTFVVLYVSYNFFFKSASARSAGFHSSPPLNRTRPGNFYPRDRRETNNSRFN